MDFFPGDCSGILIRENLKSNPEMAHECFVDYKNTHGRLSARTSASVAAYMAAKQKARTRQKIFDGASFIQKELKEIDESTARGKY